MLSKVSQMEVELLVFSTRQSRSELVSFTYLPVSHQISKFFSPAGWHPDPERQRLEYEVG